MSRLPCDVRGLIVFLESNGALSPAQREMLIDRLLAMPDDEITSRFSEDTPPVP